MVVANNEINETKNAGKMMTISMAMPPGRYGAMRITQWNTFGASCEATMLPSGKCPCHIAPAAAMVNEFVETTQNTNKHNF